jgi:chitin synthase
MRRSKSTKQSHRTSNQIDKEATSKIKKVIPVVLAQLRSSLDELFATIDETMPWFIFCIRPNLGSTKNNSSLGFDSQSVLAQVQAFNLNALATRLKTGSYQNIFLHSEFCDRYANILLESGVEPDRLPRSKCQALIDIFGWATTKDAVIGNSKVTQAR